MKTNTHPRTARRFSLVQDDRGVAMLEFVLIAPILCYLIVAILFFRDHIDYSQDQVSRTRLDFWLQAIPGAATSATGSASDADSFFTVPLSAGLAVAGAAGANVGSVGYGLAAERYFGSTPYKRIDLKVNNYRDAYVSPQTMVEGPWGEILGNFGKFFGTSIGTGQYQRPDGLKTAGWEDRYPQSVNPWMRHYREDLDPEKYLIVGYALDLLNGFTLFRCPVPRVDNRDNIDIGKKNLDNGRYGLGQIGFLPCFNDSSCTKLKLTQVTTKSQIKTIIQ